ncbi:hypothetical protein U5817_09840 [Aromatoleum evansii]|uniref:Uncharacterized protein n=1 Tax=Aromatoleum evansii TaxID=59406 RepID=A0ABZ1AR38_AROEV|nr:hypothetical protein U5817_09490 [Aromatoleum evansii]WRL48327.1 hypothetical protein U5817_09840 [Aromatoleum evansii]
MLIQNHRHVPGPGDRMPPDMHREEARREARPEAVKVISDFIFAERMASLAWISDAQGDFLQAEYNAMDATIAEIAAKTAAILENGQTGSSQLGLLLQKLGGQLFAATEASIRRGADKEAEIRLDRMEREDEAGYLVEQEAS